MTEAISGATDAELVERVLAADREAFAVVYDRYGPRLYDFAYSMLRQREDAADAVADSFVTFAEKLPQLRDRERLRPWLYAIVRSECLRRLKARKRLSYGDDEQLAEMADESMTPGEAAEKAAQERALQQLVWDAAVGLADRDRALLDLHLRQGLEGAELGEAMGVSASNAYVMLTRLRSQVDRSLGALLIARTGREECAELDTLLADWDGSFSPLIRKRVARHVEGCTTCGERRQRMLSPWALLAGVPLFAAPAALRRRVVEDTRLVAYSGGANAAGEQVPSVAPRHRRGRVAGAGLAAAALIAAAIVLWPSADDHPTQADDLIAGTPGPTLAGPTGQPTLPTPTAAVTLVPTPSPTPSAPTAIAAPGELRLSTTRIDLGSSRSSGSVTVTNTGGTAVSFVASTGTGAITVAPTTRALAPGASTTLRFTVSRAQLVEGPIDEAITLTSAGSRSVVRLTGTNEVPPQVRAPQIGASTCSASGRTYQVSVVASDSVGVRSVRLVWSGVASGSTQLTPSPSRWSGQLGPFPAGGAVSVQAIATDARGNTASAIRTFSVTPCPQ